MPKIAYIERRFSADSLAIIAQANRICADYAAQGFDLTLRQLYYQFVSRGLIANKDTEYKRLGSVVNDARLAGLIDWNYIVDRTRNLRDLAHWNDPRDIMRGAAAGYRIDKWATQPHRIEVWIEKDALVGVIQNVCQTNDVPFFSCRGYTSQSEVWGAARRLLGYRRAGQEPLILHLGDHDPSGKDMTRDIGDRLDLFMEGGPPVNRLALNWDQIDQYQPPPNPAKITDSRATKYIAEFGTESWELDALEPTVIAALISDAIDSVRDAAAWDVAIEQEETEKALIQKAASRWREIVEFLEEDEDEEEN